LASRYLEAKFDGLGLESCIDNKLKQDNKLIIVVIGFRACQEIRHGSRSVTCNYTNACLYFVSIHQMAPPQTEVAGI